MEEEREDSTFERRLNFQGGGAMDKLKPCPFCGGEGCVQEHVFKGLTNTYGVVCLDCCAEIRQFYRTEEEAIKAWNRRTDG